jgi:hypothetical protein
MFSIAAIDQRLITAYHARANGAAERMVQTHSQAVYKLLEGRACDWDNYIPAVQLFINMKITRRHGSSPYLLLFARQPNYFADYRSEDSDPVSEQALLDRLTYMNNIVYPAISDETQQTMKMYRDQFTKKNLIISDKFTVGSLVMVRNELRKSKDEERFTGPYKVKERTVNGTYLLIDAIGTEFYRAPSALKLVKSNLDAAEVEQILEERRSEKGAWE